MTAIKNLEDLLYHEIQVMWSAESQIIEAMPKMIDRAIDSGLKALLAEHLQETQQQKVILENICKQLGLDPTGDPNPGMAGILGEGEVVMHKDATDEAMDATLIAGAQKVEHYEISGYGSAVHYAQMLGETEIASQLAKILAEEQDADTKLNAIAKSRINLKAQTTGDDLGRDVTSPKV